MKKAIKIIAGAVLLCSGCAAVCALYRGAEEGTRIAQTSMRTMPSGITQILSMLTFALLLTEKERRFLNPKAESME